MSAVGPRSTVETKNQLSLPLLLENFVLCMSFILLLHKKLLSVYNILRDIADFYLWLSFLLLDRKTNYYRLQKRNSF